MFLHELSSIPIYCQPSQLLSTVQCTDVLLDPELSPDLICTRVPFDINCNSVFVVDMSKLAHPKDVACDDMGSWKWKGSYRMWISVDEKGFTKTLGKTLTKTLHLPHYWIWKRYYENSVSSGQYEEPDSLGSCCFRTYYNFDIFK